MSPVAHFFGEDVAGVDVARDVADVHLLGLDAVAAPALATGVYVFFKKVL